jgi:hypothetical protein
MRFRKISLVELSTIFYDWPGNPSYHVKQVLITHAFSGELQPFAFSNPGAFVERLCNNFLYEIDIGVDKLEHFESSLKCTSTTFALLHWLLVEAEDRKSDWHMIVKRATDKTLSSFDKELILSSKDSSPNKNFTEKEINKIRKNPPDVIPIMIPPERRTFCNNPACAYHNSVAPIKLKMCSKCESSFYCSLDCQKIHWTSHKHHCIKK